MDCAEDHESRVQRALEQIADGAMTYEQAHEEYRVGVGTLHGRKQGARSRREAHEGEKKLSSRLERSIQQWILFEEAANRPPTKAQVREFAEQLCQLSGNNTTLGQRWVDRFISRHPQVQMKVGVPLSSARVYASTKERLEGFLRAVDEQIRKKGIKTKNIINMDENGLGSREITRHKVLGKSETAKTTVSAPDSSTWTSILEGITADGRRLTPVMVLEGKSIQKQWIPTEVPNYKWINSDNGWSTGQICHRWLTEVFLPETAPESREWRLLLLDGSSTHTAPGLMARAWHEKVVIRYLPAHTSHLAQPCDKGPFGPLKRYFREEAALTTYVPETAPINKRLTISCYKVAAEKAFNERNILSGFSHTGIVPFNPQKLLESAPDEEDLQATKSAPARAATPDNTLATCICTPKKASDLFMMAEQIVDQQNAVQRDVRTLIRKTGKQLDNSLGEIATLKHENARLNTLVEELRPRKRQRIQKDPNQAFFDIASILDSNTRPSLSQQQLEDREGLTPERISLETTMYHEDELQHSFHI